MFTLGYVILLDPFTDRDIDKNYCQDANGYRPDAGIRQQKLDLIQVCEMIAF
jgi:hypothetical protein